MATPSKPPKTMSSRLLTMKFMQRAAATPDKDDGPPAKKSRLSNGSAVAASPPSSSPRTTAQAVQEALAAEEQKRLEALEREGANKGETKWYLSVKHQPDAKTVAAPLQIVSAGYSTLDSGVGDEPGADSGDEEEEDEDAVQRRSYGRRNFGKFRKATEQNDKEEGSSDSSDGDGESDEDGRTRPNRKETDVDALIARGQRDAAERARAERRAKKGRDNVTSRDPSDDRRRKHVNLNRVSGVSSGGGSPLRHPNKRPYQRRRE